MDALVNTVVRFFDRIVLWPLRWFCGWFGRRRRLLNAVDSLDDSEREVLLPFVQARKNTLRLPRHDPVIEGLLKKAVLEVVGAVSMRDMKAPMMIAPEVRERVEKRLKRTCNE